MKEKPVQPAAGSLIRIESISGELRDPARHMAGILERLFGDLRPNTLRAYKKAWDLLAAHLGLPDRISLARELIKLDGGQANGVAMDWVAAMHRQKLSAATVSARLSALKGVTKRLRILGAISWKIEVKGPEVNKYKDTTGPGTEKVMAALILLRERTDPKGVRDTAIIHALYTTGLRRSELANITLEDLELDKDRVWITGKGRDDREHVKVPEKARLALEAWLKIRPKGEARLFLNLDPAHYGQPLSDQGIWRITTSYGIGRPHGLRHSGITAVLNKSNGNVRMAKEFSRHKTLDILVRYDDNRKNLAGEASDLLDGDL